MKRALNVSEFKTYHVHAKTEFSTGITTCVPVESSWTGRWFYHVGREQSDYSFTAITLSLPLAIACWLRLSSLCNHVSCERHYCYLKGYSLAYCRLTSLHLIVSNLTSALTTSPIAGHLHRGICLECGGRYISPRVQRISCSLALPGHDAVFGFYVNRMRLSTRCHERCVWDVEGQRNLSG